MDEWAFIFYAEKCGVIFSVDILCNSWCREGESNPHGARPRGILSPVRLPVSPSRRID